MAEKNSEPNAKLKQIREMEKEEANERDKNNKIREERKRYEEQVKKIIGKIYRLPIKDIETCLEGYSNKEIPKYWIFELLYLEKKWEIYLDYSLLSKDVEIGTIVDVMIAEAEVSVTHMGPESWNEYGHYSAIPSPVKYEYMEQWDAILSAYRHDRQISATIKEIKDKPDGYGFMIDIGCEITVFWEYPAYYLQNQKVGDKVAVHINEIFKKYRNSFHRNTNTYYSFKVILSPPDRDKLSEAYNIQKHNETIQIQNKWEAYINNTIQNKKSNIFILDTNIIMDFPKIIQYIIEQNRQAIVPYIVIEELDGLKECDVKEKSQKARNGLREVDKNISSIKIESSSSSLIPSGLDNRKNDNLIISIALANKNYDPIIITNDIGMIVKARSLNIETWDCTKDMEI